MGNERVNNSSREVLRACTGRFHKWLSWWLSCNSGDSWVQGCCCVPRAWKILRVLKRATGCYWYCHKRTCWGGAWGIVNLCSWINSERQQRVAKREIGGPTFRFRDCQWLSPSVSGNDTWQFFFMGWGWSYQVSFIGLSTVFIR